MKKKTPPKKGEDFGQDVAVEAIRKMSGESQVSLSTHSC